MAQTVPRAFALDLLPAIGNAKAEIFIKPIEDEALSWTAYSNPFSNEMWLVLFLISLVISFFLTLIENFFLLKRSKIYTYEVFDKFMGGYQSQCWRKTK